MKTITLAAGQVINIAAPAADTEQGISPKHFGSLLRSIESAWNSTDEEHATEIAAKVAARGLSCNQLLELSQHLIVMGASGLSIKPDVEVALRNLLAVTPAPVAVHAESDDVEDAAAAPVAGGSVPPASNEPPPELPAGVTETETATDDWA